MLCCSLTGLCQLLGLKQSTAVRSHSGGFCNTLTPAGLKCCGGQIEDDPAGKSAEIIEKLLAEMSALFPDKVMNLGCDETGSSPPCTLANTKSFEVKMIKKLLSLKKQPMGWEEILFKTGAAADYPSVIVDSWARSSWSEAAAAGHPTVMSNSGIFYLDYAGHSAKSMWIDMMKDNSNTTQRKLLLGGEVSMWQDQYVGSCMFDNKQDENFTQSNSHCIWPRTAIAAGTFWGNYRPDVDDDWFNKTFLAVQGRLGERNVDSCPCATLTSNGCSQMSFCGVGYCGPVPPPPGPPPPTCAAFATPEGYGCMGETSGNPSLLLKPAANITGAYPNARIGLRLGPHLLLVEFTDPLVGFTGLYARVLRLHWPQAVVARNHGDAPLLPQMRALTWQTA